MVGDDDGLDRRDTSSLGTPDQRETRQSMPPIDDDHGLPGDTAPLGVDDLHALRALDDGHTDEIATLDEDLDGDDGSLDGSTPDDTLSD